ncbi:DEAD/DEAH box helicase [Thermaerobacillus caldiproteolyticus]|uniref:DEAD/DEAH box helicase n=1 Tax=Thermaerobacillus caldiproteolyticus TaxID=247480 RepID=UPI00188C7F96|nr:SNF2-related protein [Anoxybacillus caldiproteolyticus]QPA30038.1 DEAD/DEAH box helicase [Anoxybacillus caldiproteolyticus]
MIDIEFDTSWKKGFLERVEKDGPWTSWELYQLSLEAATHLSVPDFDGLQAPKHLPHLTPLPHQLEVARQVVEKMNGKAILADEVGLGKTIEAGLILKEYMIRGLVKKVLILVPASLVSQWAMELNEKFFIPAVQQKKSYVWEQCDVVVSSIDTAKKSPHREIIYQQQYDMVIIDEAHKLKNNKTKNYEFVQNLKKKFCLLLTATPIQNRIEEIFNLVSLLKPGHLGNAAYFTEMYGKKRSLQTDEHLKALVNKVMIRNRRADTGIEWSKRHVETVMIEFSNEERELYNAVQALKYYDTKSLGSQFSLITMLREACSSREALFLTLKNMMDKYDGDAPAYFQELLEKMNAVTTNSKAEKALELIQNINDKVIIFTEYRATQLYLQWFLKQQGISSVPFRGGFKRGKKDWMKELFKSRAQVLIATEAGGEGINLQFCHHVINYDLPWNPMRLEQRIGRVHRLGQMNDVHIYNFAVKDTIEEHMLKLLYEKIHLFERVVGELDDILAKMNMNDFEDYLHDIFFHSRSEGEMKIKIENLTAMIDFADQLAKGGEHYAAT